MIISIFKDKNYIFWADYSKKDDCLWVFIISDEEKRLVENLADFSIKKKKLIIKTNKKVKENFKTKKIENLKEKTSEKIYEKYSKEKQKTVLYTSFFTFANRILKIPTIKSEFTSEELEILREWKEIFLDMQKDIIDYKKEKKNILINK